MLGQQGNTMRAEASHVCTHGPLYTPHAWAQHPICLPQMGDMNNEARSDAGGTEAASEEISEDVHHALVLVKQLQRENKQLADNFDSLKALHLQLATSHKQLELNYAQLQQERVAVEKQYQQLCESWKLELEEKQKQFDQARSQILQPRDLDVLRVQLLTEVEAPFKAKCDRLAKEAETAQAQYVRMRREYEVLQNSYQALGSRMEGESQLKEAEVTSLEAGLRERGRQLEAEQARTHALELQSRALRAKEEEARLGAGVLRAEVSELRAAKEAAVVEREQAGIRADRRVQALQMEVVHLQGLAESLARKVRHLQAELGEATTTADANHDKLLSLQATNTALSSQLADTTAAAARERQLLLDRLAAAEREWQSKLHDVNKQLMHKDQALAAAAMSERGSRAAAEAAAAEQVASTQGAAVEKLRAAADREARLSAQLGAAQEAAAAWQQRYADAQDRARLEVLAARQEAATTTQDLSSAQRTISSLQQHIQDLTGVQLDSAAAGDLQLQLGEGGGRPGSSWESRLALERRCGALEERIGALQQQLQELSEQLAMLGEGRGSGAWGGEAAQQMAAAQAGWAQERAELERRYESKLRKMKEAAKQQIIDLRDKLRSLKSSGAEMSVELGGLRVALAEREAELAAISRLAERPGTPGSAVSPAWSPAPRPSPGAGHLAASSSSSPWGRPPAAGEPGGPGGLDAALEHVRQRQEQYLRSLGQAA